MLLHLEVYVAAVLVPFVAYLLAQTGYYTFSGASVKLSLTLSSLASASVLVLTFVTPIVIFPSNVELNTMGMGIGFGILGLFVGQMIERYVSVSKVGEEVL